MILDVDGDELLYVPIPGLESGQDSATWVIGILTPRAAWLKATPDVQVQVFARRHGTADPFVDISQTYINLAALPVGITQFDVYLHASEDIEGFPRAALGVGAAVSTPANWRSS